MRTQDFHFFSGPRLKLAGRLYLPDPANDKGAGAVFCVGFGGTKEWSPVGVCTLLAQAGYTMLSFDYRGFGGSEGERARLLPQEQVEDTVCALEYLATQVPGIDPRRIGVFGTSFGGGIAALAAVCSPRVRALVMSVPVTSGSQWLRAISRWHEFREIQQRAMDAIARKAATGEIAMAERLDIMVPDPGCMVRYAQKTPITMETAYHVLHHEPIEQAHKIKVPVCIFAAEDDTNVPYEQAVAFHDRLACERRMETFPVGNHWCVYEEQLPRVASVTAEWFGKHLA
jgi:dipeptidyl aminopeptidase/acylaminoacyl peptidase